MPIKEEHALADEVEMAKGLVREYSAHAKNLSDEVERLKQLIHDTGKHWLALETDFPIPWEGAIDSAMKAACDEIRRLRT